MNTKALVIKIDLNLTILDIYLLICLFVCLFVSISEDPFSENIKNYVPIKVIPPMRREIAVLCNTGLQSNISPTNKRVKR